MAIDYDLDLSTSLSPQRAIEMIDSQISGLTRSKESPWLFDSSVTISFLGPPKIATAPTIEEFFHFTPTLSIGFRHGKEENDSDRAWDVMLRTTILLLPHAGDAVLLFNGEIIVLQRLGGQLVLNTDYSIMNDDEWLKSRITLPFERRSLPSPLL